MRTNGSVRHPIGTHQRVARRIRPQPCLCNLSLRDWIMEGRSPARNTAKKALFNGGRLKLQHAHRKKNMWRMMHLFKGHQVP